MNSTPPLKIAVLGMADNEMTKKMVAGLIDARVPLYSLIYWIPPWRDQWRRLVRKIKAAGIQAAIQRIFYAVRSQAPQKAISPSLSQIRFDDLNSSECANYLKQEQIDLVIVVADCILKTKFIRALRIGALNTHPGWTPRYRGLGANLTQIKDGYWPAITAHLIDEGIDTGPILFRQQFQFNLQRGIEDLDEREMEEKLKAIIRGVKILEQKPVVLVDTFLEPSRMTRGVSDAERRQIDEQLKTNKSSLKFFDTNLKGLPLRDPNDNSPSQTFSPVHP